MGIKRELPRTRADFRRRYVLVSFRSVTTIPVRADHSLLFLLPLFAIAHGYGDHRAGQLAI